MGAIRAAAKRPPRAPKRPLSREVEGGTEAITGAKKRGAKKIARQRPLCSSSGGGVIVGQCQLNAPKDYREDKVGAGKHVNVLTHVKKQERTPPKLNKVASNQL